VQVLAIRLADRVGKGIRTSPRDALIADSVDPSIRGRAFGFHRAADHAGAVVGPLAAFAALHWGGVGLRPLFWAAAIPGVLGVLVLVVSVRERARAARGAEGRASGHRAAPRPGGAPGDDEAGHAAPNGGATRVRARGAPPEHHDAIAGMNPRNPSIAPATDRAPLGARFWAFLGVLFLFTLGNSTDAFLLLRATQLGVSAALIPILWAMLHVVKSASSTPGGALSDRVGRKPLIVGGWLLFAAVYFAFGRASVGWQVWALFAVYGLFFGLTEGTEKALVADLVPAERRGTAFGWYNLAIGLGALPASLLFGTIWDRVGPAAAFGTGAALALAAAAGTAIVAPRRPRPAPSPATA
jgi:MFS family permease